MGTDKSTKLDISSTVGCKNFIENFKEFIYEKYKETIPPIKSKIPAKRSNGSFGKIIFIKTPKNPIIKNEKAS